MALPEFKGDDFEFPDEKETKGKAREKDDDFKVEIEDDTPPADRGRKAAPPPDDVSDDELASYDEKVQSRLKKFTRGYHDERRAKESAERERQAAEDFARQVFEENKRLKQQISNGSKAFIATSKSAAQIELESAEKKFKAAYEAGDADALTTAQKEIARATMKVDKAETMRPVELDKEDKFQPPAREDAQQPKVSPRTKKWIDSNNDWFGSDDEMTMAAMGIDKKLQREYGADYVGTEEYFRTVDKTMRKRFPEYFDTQSYEEEDAPPPRKRAEPAEEDEPPRRATRSAAVVAPASRSTPPNRVKLKASQVALARKLGVSPEEYAKQVALLNRGE
jgi:hypothetical protein